MVTDGRMPKPFPVDTRRLWDRWKLDEAVSALSDADSRDPWEEDAA
jgi:hypothetical protein